MPNQPHSVMLPGGLGTPTSQMLVTSTLMDLLIGLSFAVGPVWDVPTESGLFRTTPQCPTSRILVCYRGGLGAPTSQTPIESILFDLLIGPILW